MPACLFYVHPILDNKFYMCIDDQAKLLTCPEGSIFYPEREQCDLPKKEVRSAKNTFRRPAPVNRQQLFDALLKLETSIRLIETQVFGNATTNAISTFIAQNSVPIRPPGVDDAKKPIASQSHKPGKENPK